ncbi:MULTISPECIES: M13 family metallopeptidase [Stenotrophomonas]|uniref:M13 family metallopeptidase n=1 Tax=Stenotrophomonas TaxID=40323 RepID=UPI000D7E27A5|nr:MULTISPECIES: M13 family metallopeptidase [Stenotrophomonas]AWT15701.1 peptidase M13 [Stenotrophomonas maltophilia]ELF4099750.1 M13 family metallopeptidase [Stenotrophomonas maltophilia]MBA0362156.1 M13 family peptidase [Stenotrophomonas maltophilia]MBA0428581.1 M13 family peptidase [Stenotrophomonas maltophilia]MDH0273205.1 M13 family metallopeptidase [Stenotrophomonas sp. GD04089]
MPNFRPLAIALGISLATLVPTHDAFAAAKKKAARAPAVSAQCSDFYDATNAGWLKANPVPQTGATTALGQLVDRSRQQQRELLDAAMKSPQGNVQKLLGDFWASGLDEAAVEADGSNPIAPLLTRINAIKKAKDVPASIAALHQVGIPVAFNFGPDVDLKALDRHIGYFMQGGMGLPDPAFYTRTDADTVALMGRYRNYVKQILALTGTPAAKLDAESQAVIALETELARNAQSLAGINNPFNNYAPISTKELNSRYRNLQLDAFLKAQGVDDDLVSLADPGLFKQLDGMVTKLKPDQWKAYLRWRVGDSMAPYLSKAYRDAEFEFRGRVLRGETLPPQRWEDVLDAINVAAGPMVGREYAARYLSAEDRRQAAWIVDKVREVQIEAVKNSSWMSAEAKTEAQAKLAALKIEIGTPLRDLDYTVQPMGRGSFGGNMLIASTWRHREEMRRIGKGNADRRWDVLPQQPSLAYDLAQNRLIVTAAILQGPVFNAKADAADKFGSFGGLVGHELTRAIDAKGALVDAKGELRSWWTPADKTAWTLLGNRVAAQYGAYDFPGVKGAKVNGALTQEENLADIAGLELAWAAYVAQEPKAKQAQQQGFFRAWSALWAQQLSPNEAVRRLTADIRAPGVWRSNGTLANLPAFGATFSCKAGQPMQRSEADQIKVWR